MKKHTLDVRHTEKWRNSEEQKLPVTETGIEIGKGSRARIMEVITANGERAVMKKFSDPDAAQRAMRGHSILERNLPESEKPLLVPMELDQKNNAVVMPILNEKAWVISMGKNTSIDRTDLSQNKLSSIPNFNACVTRLMNGAQAYGERCLEMGPDVYFLTIDRATREIGYVYADTESVTGRPTGSPDDAPIKNIFWAAGALNLFLRECVQNPDPYLVRVRQEAMYRMESYFKPDRFWQNELLTGANLSWPKSNWRQKLAWVMELLRRQVAGSWRE